MCERLGIPAEFLPEIHPCHEVIGKVTEKAAAESGLAVGTPVVAGRSGRGVRNLRRGGYPSGRDSGTGRSGGRHEHLHRYISGGSEINSGIPCGSGPMAASGRHYRRRGCYEVAGTAVWRLREGRREETGKKLPGIV